MNFVISNLFKTYKGRLLLDNINLDINKNSSIALVGPNGNGKTLLAECIGYGIPYRGTITLDNKPLSYFSDVMHYVPQLNQIPYENFNSVIVDMEYNYIAKVGLKPSKNLIKQFIDMLNICQIHPNTPIRWLSIGQYKQVKVIESIITKPKIMILDEPTASIDIVARVYIFNFIKQYKSANPCLLILVTHYPEEVVSLCEYAYLIKKGKISKPIDTTQLSCNSSDFIKQINFKACF